MAGHSEADAQFRYGPRKDGDVVTTLGAARAREVAAGLPVRRFGSYGRTKAQWWNQYSPNPSTADGSWTLQVGHGPMDCKGGRAQRCQWR